MPQAKRLQSFRSRFDTKYFDNSELRLALLPPFEIEKKEYSYCVEKIQEEADSYLFGGDYSKGVNFKEIGVFQGRKNIMYLRPQMNSDICYFQERIDEFLIENSKSYRGYLIKKSNRTKPFLCIGRFMDTNVLNFALDLASIEIGFPLRLHLGELVLWEKMKSNWNQVDSIYKFKDPSTSFLQDSSLSL